MKKSIKNLASKGIKNTKAIKGGDGLGSLLAGGASGGASGAVAGGGNIVAGTSVGGGGKEVMLNIGF